MSPVSFLLLQWVLLCFVSFWTFGLNFKQSQTQVKCKELLSRFGFSNMVFIKNSSEFFFLFSLELKHNLPIFELLKITHPQL